MNKNALINIVGLSKKLIGPQTPFLSQWIADKTMATIDPILPSVTCSVQSTYLTGKMPKDHGIVANGWYFRDECEVKLWRQSNKLVRAPKIWDLAKERNPAFTCANMFWWYNMYSTADYSVTPRPQYRANGLKIPDCYSEPNELRSRLQSRLGPFPLFHFWGPRTTIKSSQWIADASKLVFDWHQPDLLLVYLPHLDYCFQKFGNDESKTSKDLNEIDALCEELFTHLEDKGVTVNIISEYGITDVDRPIHINRILRREGLLAIREENDLEILDAGASHAFAMADHQIAHIYVRDHERISDIKQLLQNIPGIAEILDQEGKTKAGLDHPRSGELIAVADPRSWFTYYYWIQDALAPDFARTVDIHKKPGYDPVEMFLDPKKNLLRPRIALKLLSKNLGFRTIMDLIPLDASLIRGSHGQQNLEEEDRAVFISSEVKEPAFKATQIQGQLLTQIFGS